LVITEGVWVEVDEIAFHKLSVKVHFLRSLAWALVYPVFPIFNIFSSRPVVTNLVPEPDWDVLATKISPFLIKDLLEGPQNEPSAVRM
jgi:hypothetical protein